MAQWNLTANWSSGDLVVTGTTSARVVLFSEGNNLHIPSVRGRSDITLVDSTSGPYIAGYTSNPLNWPLWVENMVLNITTVGASSNFITTEIGLAPTSSGVGTALQDSVECTTVGVMSGNTGGIFAKWMSTEYIVCLNESDSSCSSGMSGHVSIFWTACAVSSS